MIHRSTILICSFGCVWIAYAQIKEWLTWRRLKKDGQTTSAVITDLYPQVKRLGKNIYVSYRFEAFNKKSYTGKQWVNTDEYKNVALGLSIPVRYLRSKPSVSVIENDSGRTDRAFASLFVFIMLLIVLLRTIGSL